MEDPSLENVLEEFAEPAESDDVDSGTPRGRNRVAQVSNLPAGGQGNVPAAIAAESESDSDVPWESAHRVSGEECDPQALDAASQPYIGRWNQLVSTTNWEKGRIILQWREALVSADAPAGEYSDEAWARRVGGVTGQHVGRLRRVYQRFGPVYETYAGLYWSHFQAALDWQDAEMWLEGAVQSAWSVSQMRHQRWETLEDATLPPPRDEEIVGAELDEDFEPALNESPEPRPLSTPFGEIPDGPRHDGPDFGDEESATSAARGTSDGAAISSDDDEAIEFVRPFENLSELPDDLADAFESYKLTILRHKLEGWKQVSLADVLASLDALKELARAPSSEQAS